MRKESKTAIVSMLAMGMVLPAAAQDRVEGALGTDVVSAYIWRGQENGGVSIQPAASLGWKGLSLGAWGSFEVTPDNPCGKEIDVTLSYSVKGFTVGVTDYYIAGSGDGKFFTYGNPQQTPHTFEANVGYDFGFLAVNWYTNFAGADYYYGSGHRAYSSYFQLDAPFKLGKLDWNATVGFVPYATGFYAADKATAFHVNTAALRCGYDICFGKFTLPVFAQFVVNPSSKDAYFLAGLTLKAL